MHRPFHFVLSIASLTLLPSAAKAADGALDLLFHADVDGNFAVPSCKPGQADALDYARLLGVVAEARTQAAVEGLQPPVLLLGGNIIAPGLFARGLLKRDGDAGADALAALLVRGGYHAIALGHHDLSAEPARLQRFLGALRAQDVPVVASNLRCDDARAPLCATTKPHVVLDRDGRRVAVLAVLSPLVLPGLAPENRAGLALLSPAEIVPKLVAQRRAEGADDVVLMAQGPRAGIWLEELLSLQRRLASGEAPDIVLAGGLGTEDGDVLRAFRRDAGPAVVGSTRGVDSLAHVHLPAAEPGVARAPVVKALTPGAYTREDPAAASILRRRTDDYCARYGTPMGPGRIRGPITRAEWLGYVLAVMRREADAEIALLNRDFVKNTPFPWTNETLTRADFLRALPYEAVLGTVRLGGAQMAALLGPALASDRLVALGAERGPGGALTVNGRPIDRARQYEIATIGFVAAGGDDLFSADALPFVPLPGAPDVRALVERFIETETATEDGDPSIDPRTDFGPPASERLLLVGISDVSLDLTNVSIQRQPGYSAPQLTRAEQRAVKAELVGLLQLRAGRHEADGRLRVLYGYARNQPADKPPASAETADLVALSTTYNFRGLRDLETSLPRPLLPDPYGRLLLESELSVPPLSADQPRDWRYAELTATTGALFTVTPKLRVRGGPGVRKQLFAPGVAGDSRFLVEAGATLDPIALASLGPLVTRLEGNLDYLFIEPTGTREHQLRAVVRLSVPLVPYLFLTAGVDTFAMQREGRGWGVAFDTTLGLRVHLDAAHQRL